MLHYILHYYFKNILNCSAAPTFLMQVFWRYPSSSTAGGNWILTDLSTPATHYWCIFENPCLQPYLGWAWSLSSLKYSDKNVRSVEHFKTSLTSFSNTCKSIYLHYCGYYNFFLMGRALVFQCGYPPCRGKCIIG